ncbi:MAG: hypothetical protein R3242_08800 [Akkermansiaceae bacterium]|nr:hypothetical protein [Akkermansiaceae bacterium]
MIGSILWLGIQVAIWLPHIQIEEQSYRILRGLLIACAIGFPIFTAWALSIGQLLGKGVGWPTVFVMSGLVGLVMTLSLVGLIIARQIQRSNESDE